MCTEIEAKLRVDSLQVVESKLEQLGAEFIAEQLQTDTHFDDANATLKNADRCLRLRRQIVGGNTRFILTYKGAKEKSNFKKRQELEVEIMNADSIEKILMALGYERKLSVEKKRRLWRLCKCEVALDQLQVLGDFVEIEGADDKQIAHVQEKLGLAGLPHIPKGYASMIMESLSQSDKK